MPDRIETFGDSLIQHGPENNRVYLMKLAPGDLPLILVYLDDLARRHGYGKLFAKVPAAAGPLFTEAGYVVEACVPDFFRGEEDAVFFGKYLEQERAVEERQELVDEVLLTAAAADPVLLAPAAACERLQPEDAGAMAELYREVFASYPFPIYDPDYLEETMRENVAYFGIRGPDGLLAAASAEVDPAGQNAEMTDFATHPEARGAGLATSLLAAMETCMRSEEVRTAYTIARAYSFGMNITFARCNYVYSGTLTNNTQIAGGIESMNVWHKSL